jgi:hypothetical protein
MVSSFKKYRIAKLANKAPMKTPQMATIALKTIIVDLKDDMELKLVELESTVAVPEVNDTNIAAIWIEFQADEISCLLLELSSPFAVEFALSTVIGKSSLFGD